MRGLAVGVICIVMMQACVGDDVFFCEAVDEAEPAQTNPLLERFGINALSSNLWRKREIPVCWERETWEKTTQADRDIVRRAVEETWETALAQVPLEDDQLFRFSGWNGCHENVNAAINGIRMNVNDERPNAAKLGRHLAGVRNGVTHNFTFENWNSVCSWSDSIRRGCIYVIAVHEFGHALGLAHEQNRLDTPETCTEEKQGTDGDTYVGRWDIDSVMNYCNPHWNNGGELSALDQQGIRNLYYPDIAKVECEKFKSGQ